MGKTLASPRRPKSVLLAAVVATAVAATALAGGPAPPPGQSEPAAADEEPPSVSWESVELLLGEQKVQAALEMVGEIRTAAVAADDTPNWTRALIEEVQMRTGLHGYETAVRFLMTEPWPDEPSSRAILDLFYAAALVSYSEAYSWEIRQRERMVSEEEVDLKAWTLNEIAEQAQAAYLRVWQTRDQWGSESLGEFSRYIEQNNYPARIRGTLRDAVSYLWVELLADTSLWRPEQSNEIYRLDIAALIAGDPAVSAAVALDDPRTHPLEKLGAVLDDLEAWHAVNGRDEAALEVRLERARQLRDAFTNSDDKLEVRRNLEEYLDGFDHSLEWWAMGQAELAEQIRSEDAGDALVRARAAAAKGSDRHPDSVGGTRCRYIVASIEAPSYSLAAMAVDGPGRRSIRITHKNLDTLFLRAYSVDLLRHMEESEDYNLLPGRREIEHLIKTSRPAAEWRMALPETPDFRDHQTYDTPPLSAPGAYVIVASARRHFKETDNQLNGAIFVVSDIVLVRRLLQDSLEITARSGRSGKAVKGVDVRLYRTDYGSGHLLERSGRTNRDGVVEFNFLDTRPSRLFVIAVKGEHVAVDQRQFSYRRAGEETERTTALVYTDRTVYRPQQTLYWKAVVYAGNRQELDYRTLPRHPLTVTLQDANGEEVASAEVETNDYGSASGVFDIPVGRLLGGWSLRTSVGGDARVRVEEYKRPTFAVEVSEPSAPMRLNRPATLSGEVRYYFGLPVSEGNVSWQVRREPVYPRWWWWRPPSEGEAQTIAAGEATLDADGGFTVAFTPEVDEREAAKPGMSYRFRLSVDVTDAGGETRSASRVFRLGFVSVEARIDSDSGFLRAREASELIVHRSDLDGTPRPGAGTWRLVQLQQPAEALLPADQPVAREPGEETFSTPGDELRPRWNPGYDPARVMASWDEGKEVASGSLEHGEDGRSTVALKGLKAGAYRLKYETMDDFGAACTADRELVVAGRTESPVALPSLLLLERGALEVGDTARLLVRSGLDDQEMVLEVFSDSKRRSRRVLHSGEDAELIEIPITESDRGGLGIALTLVRDHQLMRHEQQIFVPWDNKELALEFATFRDRLRPGSEETFTITVRGPDGETVERGAAEVLAYMYDKSLDIFAAHSPPRVASLYPMRTGVPRASVTLGSARVVWHAGRGLVDLPGILHMTGDSLKGIDPYGLGGPGGRRYYARSEPGMMAMKSMAGRGAVPMAAPMVEQALAAEPEMDEVEANADLESFDDVPPETPDEPVELRSDFSETAFFEPHLLTGEDGSATIEFTVPDSVTEWNVWLHAVTRDLVGAALHRETRSVKELMVRPYLPRFLREGDRARIKVVVNNAGEAPLEGALDLEIIDPDTDEDLRAAFGLEPAEATGVPFTVAPGGGVDLGFYLAVPPRVGEVAFRVTARAGDFSDGELRPLPVLPGRMHLMQSRFAALSGADRRELRFDDMAAADDPTRIDEQLVVSIDAQLFYSVLSALPYLVNYPYECTEQTLNRFVSSGILSSLYEHYPAVAEMAAKMSARETRLETWDSADPNRRMALEETPWLQQSRGGNEPPEDLLNVLDPRIADVERRAAMAKLELAQTSLGAFPWWPGGPPSPYMTLYILYGFSKALEFDVDVPRDMVVRAWSYMHRHYMNQIVDEMLRKDCCWETVTFLNYVLSNYPDGSWTGGLFKPEDRKRMLDHSFNHWKMHSPLLKGYLALTLERAGRSDDAHLVFDSVMDSAKTDRDLGTYWAPEDRAWLWYNDTVESHAFALRTMSELAPADGRRHGLVQWLFLNKKLNHWKSTRATAEVIYSLIHYLEQEGALAVREDATVTVGPRRAEFIFEPDEYTGAGNRVVIPGPEIDPATMSTVIVEKQSKGFAFASATWHFSTEELPDEARGDLLAVERRYFRRRAVDSEFILEPLEEGARIEVGDQVEVHLSLSARHAAEYVHLRDPRGAGFEPESTASGYRWNLGLGAYEEIRDSGTNFFFEWLPAGEYTFTYRLRAAMAGTFKAGPATMQSMYAPEFAAYSAGHSMEIGE